MAIDSIKITSLTNIGANLSYTSIFPVVDMSGTPVTDKANLQIIGNYILSQAGGANMVQAAQATLAQAVVNAAQPNITSVGTLNINTLHISGGTNGYVLQTDGTGNLSWTAQAGGGGNGVPGGSTNQIQFNSAGSFAGNVNLTWVNGNIVTTGIKTDHYYYANGAPFSGGGNVSTGDIGFANNVIYSNTGVVINNSDLGNGQTAGMSIPVQGDGNAVSLYNTYGNVTLLAGNIGNSQNVQSWSFGADGNLRLPDGTILQGDGGGIEYPVNGEWDLHRADGKVYIGSVDDMAYIDTYSPNIGVRLRSNENDWIFGPDGNLTLPSNTSSINYANGQPYGAGGSATIASNSTPGIMALGNGFVLNGSNQVSTSNLYNTNLTQPTQHYTLNLDTNGVVHLPDQSIINGSTLRGVPGTSELNYTGITIGPNSGNPENTWVWVDASNAYIATDYGDVAHTWTFGNNGTTIFPTLSTQRGDNPSGTITGQTLLFGDGGQEAVISTPDGVPGNEYSQRLVINPGAGNNYGEGGDIYLWAGRGGDGSGSGGDIKIRGGQGGANTQGGNGGDGGYIRIEAGDAASTGGQAGYVNINGGVAGYVSSGISGGAVNITGGQGQNGPGGPANITGGYAASEYHGGNVEITGGGSAGGLASYGNVNIHAGASNWNFKNDGSMSAPGNADFNGNVITLGPGASELAASLNNPTLVISDTGDAFIQAAINNVSDIGSADWVAYGHHGNDAGGWADMGFTSSFYSDPDYTITGPGTGYVIVEGYLPGQAPAIGTGSLVFATGENGTERDIIFGTGGFLTANTFGRISDANNALELTRSGASIVLPNGGIIEETSIPFGGLSGNTIALTPAGGINPNQQLLVYPTTGNDNNHLHMTSGNLYNTELYLGDDNLYVKLANTGNIIINSNDGIGNSAQWNFGTNGAILTSDALALQVPDGIPNAVTGIVTSSGSWESNPTVNIGTTGGTGTGLTVDVTESGGYASVIAVHTPGIGYSNGDTITVVSGSSYAVFTISVTINQWTFGTNGNLTAPGSIITSGSAGNITGANVVSAVTYQSSVVAVSALPAATTAGLRAFVNNANLVAAGNFGAAVGAGGSNVVPVYSDGSVWRIG
jgi:hypothetical protein